MYKLVISNPEQQMKNGFEKCRQMHPKVSLNGAVGSYKVKGNVGSVVPVVVFPCVASGVSASLVFPSSWSGSWVSAGSGVWSSGFRFVPILSPGLLF